MTPSAESVGPHADGWLALIERDVPVLTLFERPPDGPVVRVAAVGDIGLSGQVGVAANRAGTEALFAEIAPLLQSCDVVFGNLETSVTTANGTPGMFASPEAHIAALRGSGFTLLHVANNHVADYGAAALATTLAAVSGASMTPLGGGASLEDARSLVRTDHRGVRIGWLGCGRTLQSQTGEGAKFWEFDEVELLGATQAARPHCDVIVVSIHTGMMWLDYPRPEFQQLAGQLTAAGADVVVMHHAHVLQGTEMFSGRVCCYSLGNCLFDWTEGNVFLPVVVDLQRQSAVFIFDLDRSGLSRVLAIPIRVDDDWHVRWARGETGAAILSRVKRLSADMTGDFRSAFERQRAERNTGNIVRVVVFHARDGNWSYVFRSLRQVRLEHLRMLLRWIYAGVRRRVLGSISG